LTYGLKPRGTVEEGDGRQGMAKEKQKTLVSSELPLPANSTIRFPGFNERQYLYP
jgi:hypothetical protein